MEYFNEFIIQSDDFYWVIIVQNNFVTKKNIPYILNPFTNMEVIR